MTWTHNCTYYYVPKSYDGDGPAPVFAVKGTLPPLKERLILIERNVNQPSYNGKKLLIGSKASVSGTNSNPHAEKIKAILITTGTGENTKGRYDACANTYKMLTGLYGIPKGNISLFLDDNSNATLDDGEGQLSHDIDGDGINEVIVQPTKKNVLSSATNIKDKPDMLLFYYFGEISNNGNVLDVDIAAVITKEEEFAWYKYLDFPQHSTSACKAITVVDPTLGTKHSKEDSPIQISKDGVTIPVVIYNSSSYAQTYDIKTIRDNSATGRSAFDFSEITVYLGNTIYKSWVANGKNGTDIKNYSGEPQRVYLKSPNSSINGIELPPNSSDTILMTIQAYSGATSTFKLDDTFYLTLTNNENKTIGGTGFRVLISGSGTDISEPVIGEINPGIGSLGTLTANNANQQAAYKWMDKDHNTLGTGKSLTIDLGKNRREYILKVTSAKDNSVAYAYTEPIGIQISGISPNPCSSQICISTNVPTSSGTVISITNIAGTWHKDIPVKEGHK